MSFGLNIQLEEKNGTSIIRMRGRLDATSAPVLERKLADLLLQKKSRLLFDLAGVDYLSSAGLRLLLSTTKKLKNVEGFLHCCLLNEEVMEIIKMAGFERIISIFTTEEEALKAFPPLSS